MTEFSSFRESQPLQNRKSVVKMALIYTPIAVASLVLCVIAVYNIANGQNGFFFTLVIFGTIGLLTGTQAIQYLRDLTAEPIEYQGEIVRKWQKGNLLFLFMPSFYITIDSKVFSGTVSRVEDNGAYVRMESGVLGFVPRKELDLEPAKSAREMVSPGSQVNYKVTGMGKGGVYKLSCRKAEERATVGKIFVISGEEYGMLLELDLVKVTCYPHSATVERLERYDESEKRFVPAASGAAV